MGVEEAGEGVSDGRGGSAAGDGLDGAAQPAGADELSFQCAEHRQREKSDDNGELERGEVVGNEHVRQEGDESTCDIGAGDGEGGTVGSVGGGLFEAKFEA